MSARVFNPVIMTELTRLRQSTTTNQFDRPVPNFPSVNLTARVRRDLFGPVDHEETRKFVEKELAEQQKLDCERWGFDFLRDMPKQNSRYTWERVATDKVPEIYVGTRARVPLHRPIPQTPKKDYATQVLSQFPQTPEDSSVMTVTDLLNSAFNSTDFDCAMMMTEPQVTVPVIPKPVDQDEDTERCLRDGCSFIPLNVTPTLGRRAQSRITDFMKSRKRPSSSLTTNLTKCLESSPSSTSSSCNIDSAPPPMKIARRIQHLS